MNIENQLIVLYKELATITKKVQEFNKNNKLIVDSFAINLHSEHILKLKNKVIKQKGISYTFSKNNLRINFSSDVLVLK